MPGRCALPRTRPPEEGPDPHRGCGLTVLGHSTVRVGRAGRTVLTDPLLTDLRHPEPDTDRTARHAPLTPWPLPA
ncbi:MAG: hypothetical protein JWR62_562 [Modestobacter sp.]|jgi:L-ascorbate metabolism protein UlaG (beta-lactamase superfamily)|nr:hypothetical protein [Modestobacter sp.]